MIEEQLYVVMLYDGMDNAWMEVSEHVIKERAKQIWNEKTKNGTQNTCYDHIDYYSIEIAQADPPKPPKTFKLVPDPTEGFGYG